MQRNTHLHTAHAAHTSAMRAAVMGAASTNLRPATKSADYAKFYAFYAGSGSTGATFE